MENPIKMDDLGGKNPYLLKNPYYWPNTLHVMFHLPGDGLYHITVKHSAKVMVISPWAQTAIKS